LTVIFNTNQGVKFIKRDKPPHTRSIPLKILWKNWFWSYFFTCLLFC